MMHVQFDCAHAELQLFFNFPIGKLFEIRLTIFCSRGLKGAAGLTPRRSKNPARDAADMTQQRNRQALDPPAQATLGEAP
jgi:hypothetical protein